MNEIEQNIQKRDAADTVYLSSAYLAPVQYYSKLMHYPNVCIETDCNYIKQTYRNRCTIAAANGELALTIPVDKGDLIKCRTKDIRIAKHEDWQRQHWRSIVSAYKSSPFFDYYQDDFAPFYEKNWDFLWDFNVEIQQVLLSLLELEHSFDYTKAYKTSFLPNELDLREAIHPKKNAFENDVHFLSIPYYQVFEEKLGFLPNLSIIDLLFNMGNEARLVLRDSWV